MELQQQKKNLMMLVISAISLLLSIIIFIVHTYTSIFDFHRIINGLGPLSGGIIALKRIFFIIPIISFITSVIVYKKNAQTHWLPWIISSTLTFSSIAMIANGDGFVEYHFSIFMTIAIIAYFEHVKILISSTAVFAIQHFAGFVWFPQLLCGTDDYSFSLLLIHALYLILTSGATIWFVLSKARHTAKYEHTVATQRLALDNILDKMKQTNDSVLQAVAQLSSGSEQSAKASVEIVSSIETITSGAEQQTNKLNSGAESIDHIATQVKKIDEHAQIITQKANDTSEQVKLGQETIVSLSEQMNVMTAAAQKVSIVINELAKSSGEVEKLISVISSIANQTNLLALNAAIEAARAGEHGQGFAVVAAEVRALAGQSNDSATQVHAIVQAFKSHIDNALQDIEHSLAETGKGLEQITHAEQAFSDITTAALQTDTHVKQMTTATNTLLDNTLETNALIQHVTQITAAFFSDTDSILASAEEQAATSDSVSDIAVQLEALIAELDDIVMTIQKNVPST